MEKAGAIDFDLAIENCFDYFTVDPDDVPLQDQQAIFHAIKNGCHEPGDSESAVKPRTFRPKVMKNDIRRYYSRMFMNTINCGDFNQLQSYFSTFMRGPAKFFANYDNFNPNLCLPTQLVADGPKLMSHFLLGILVMYPDLVMRMHNTQITTSSSWTGTKIEMSVAFYATKMYDLSIDEWVPQLEALEEKCTQLAAEKTNKMNLNTAALSSDVDCSKLDDCASSHSETGSVKTNSSYASRDSDVSDHSNDSEDYSNIKRKRAKREVLEVNSAPFRSTHSGTIPEEYARALCAQARLLPTPINAQMTGTITMFLDENNHIQHMNMNLRPM